MTERQRKFVAAMTGEAKWCAVKAARIAGYAWPSKAGWQVAHHPDVAPTLKAEFDRICPINAMLDRLMAVERAKAARLRARKDRRNARDRARRAARKGTYGGRT